MLPQGILKEHSQALSLILRGLDVLAIIAAGCLAHFCKFGNFSLSPRYQIALLIAAILTLAIFQFFHIYESIRAKGIWRYLLRLGQASATMLVFMAGLAFLTKSGDYYSRVWFTLWAINALGLLLIFRGSLFFLLRLMRSHGWNERCVIIIGAGKLGEQLAETIQQALWTGFKVVAIFNDEEIPTAEFIAGIPVIKTPTDMHSYLTNTQETIDEIWLALPFSAELRIKTILHQLRHETITTRFVLDIFGLDLLNHSITDLAGFPVLNICSTPMQGVNRIVKAIEDRVLASLILFFISPLFFIIAIAVKLSSPGPVFYKQKRISWNGKEFSMLKFRTMPVDAEAKTGPVWAQAGELRATRIGAFLRKTSLDELPQFINVLCGQMSIVGPRPERLVFVEKFKDQIPGYMQKHLVKAGITGWAQVHGWRGNTSLEKRIEYDLYYIQHWSLLLDLKIIFLTFLRGFSNKNAY